MTFSSRTIGAVAGVFVGVYLLGLYAQTVPRGKHARLSLGLWIGFLFVALVDFAGAFFSFLTLPIPSTVVTITVDAMIWSTLLGAVVSMAFLGFREVGTDTRVPENLNVENEPEY